MGDTGKIQLRTITTTKITNDYIEEINCACRTKVFQRKGVNFIGVSQLDGTVVTEVKICLSYPEGISFNIAYGNDNRILILKKKR